MEEEGFPSHAALLAVPAFVTLTLIESSLLTPLIWNAGVAKLLTLSSSVPVSVNQSHNLSGAAGLVLSMDIALIALLTLPTASVTVTRPRVTSPAPAVTVIFVSLSTENDPPKPPDPTAVAKSLPPMVIAEASPPKLLKPEPLITVLSPFFIQRSVMLVSSGAVLSIVRN